MKKSPVVLVAVWSKFKRNPGKYYSIIIEYANDHICWAIWLAVLFSRPLSGLLSVALMIYVTREKMLTLNNRFEDSFECISFEQILHGSSEFLFSLDQNSLTEPILVQDYSSPQSQSNPIDYPKNIEVIIGKLDHCGYAGIYELKKGTPCRWLYKLPPIRFIADCPFSVLINAKNRCLSKWPPSLLSD